MTLETGSRIGVVGGGPSGSLFGYFLLTMAERLGISPVVEIFEPRDFNRPGPAGCNMCGGIISESLVQLLSTEGINLPPSVVQRGIDSYVLHMDVGTVRIETPSREKRIAAVYRGIGPRGVPRGEWESFDAYLLDLAARRGAVVIQDRVERVGRSDGRLRIETKGGLRGEYDLVAGAAGVNSAVSGIFDEPAPGYRPPNTARTFICEFFLGREVIRTYLGSSMHVFLLNLPRLEFAAIIPKGDCVTVCLLGRGIDADVAKAFLSAPEVRRCFPPGWSVPGEYCRCGPAINVLGAAQPYADRLVFIGDGGVTRLYKDGIGGAYRMAKAAARTAVFRGVSAEDFRRHYLPACRALGADNAIGKIVFSIARMIQGAGFARRGVLRMTAREQQGRDDRKRLSGVLWDTFTGSASYRDLFLRTLHPAFLGRLAFETAAGMLPRRQSRLKEDTMTLDGLGKIYRPGEVIVRQGEAGHCMYIIQSGKVEVVREHGGKEIRLAELREGDFFGEMALFEMDIRSATVRPLGESRVLTVDRKMFLRKIHEDPSLAFRVMRKMSRRIREMDEKVARLTAGKIAHAS